MKNHHDVRRIELLATVAHELRNPLAAIKSAVRVLDSPSQSKSVRLQARAVIERQIVRMARISDDLLSIGSMSSGKLQLRIERADLRDTIDAAIECCRPHLDAAEHLITLQIPDHPIEIDIDPVRITQALTNLIDNSAKYSEPRGTIAIKVDVERETATIRVTDHGIGFSSDFLPHVFGMFSQAEQARLRCRYGIGIGLSLVKRIVELHHGTVTAFSAGPGLGSTFTVRLPNARYPNICAQRNAALGIEEDSYLVRNGLEPTTHTQGQR